MFRKALHLVASVQGISVDVFSHDDLDASGLDYSCFRIPALLRSQNGSLVAFAEGRRGSCGDHGDVRLLQRISNDDGLTWSPIVQVKQEDGHTIGNPAPITDLLTGVIHLLYSRDNKQIFVTQSADGGATWCESTNLTSVVLDAPVDFIGTGPPGGIQLQFGRLITAMYYTCAEDTADCTKGKARSLTIYSDDNGATWNRGENVQPGSRTHNVVYSGGESQVAPLGTKGNELVMLSRVRGDFPSANAVDHNHAISVSKDDGVTWSNSTLLHVQSAFCQGSIVGTPSGAVLMSAPSTRNGGRANLTVWASRADASGELAFDYHTTIYSGSSAYSSLMPSLTADTYLNLFEREGSGYITMASFDYPAKDDSVSLV